MKKCFAILCMIATLFSLAACGGNAGPAGTAGLPGGKEAESASAGPRDGALRVRLVDGAGTGQLVLAGIGGGDVYTASEAELTVYLDDKTAAASDLRDGMLLTVDPGYTVLETWPGQLTGATVRAYGRAAEDDHGDICGLYLDLLEDLWKDDPSLNEDITYISVDLADAPGGLGDGEKAAVAWIFSSSHGAQGLRFGFEELIENGYVEESELYWKDGVLLGIKKIESGNDSSRKISFYAEKWRSGTGAVFYNNCTAGRGSGVQWEPYKVGSYAVA